MSNEASKDVIVHRSSFSTLLC